jgi:hypothetical protein
VVPGMNGIFIGRFAFEVPELVSAVSHTMSYYDLFSAHGLRAWFCVRRTGLKLAGLSVDLVVLRLCLVRMVW